MSLCEKYNLTLGVPIYVINNLSITKDSKKLQGSYGSLIQSYFDSRKNFPYNCKLRSVIDIGYKLKNGSYTGALGLIDKKEIDMYSRPETPFTDNQNVFFSHPVFTEEFLIGQSINKKKLKDFEFRMQLVSSFNLDFIFYCLIANLMFFVVTFFFLFFSNIFSIKTYTNYHFLKEINKLRLKKNIYFNLILVGFFWFSFFTQQFITNNMKTTKVIVDTNEFITTEEKLFDSKLKVAWIEGESDITFVKNAPINTFLHKFYLLKNDNPIKIMPKNFSLKDIPGFKYYFLFMKSFLLHIVLNILCPIQDGDGFINEKPFYSTYNVFYITKGIEIEKINYIYRYTLYSAQGDITTKLSQRLLNVKIVDSLNNNKIYKTLSSYIDDYTIFEPLTYDNFHYFFLTFFYLNLIIFLIFISFHIFV